MGGSEHLVGRDETLDRLRATFEHALAGRGRVVLVAGEPGIGKTAVLSALAEEAADRSAVVTWGQCWDDSIAPAFWPWTQVLRELDHPTAPAAGQLLSVPGQAAPSATRRPIGSSCSTPCEQCLSTSSESRGLLVVLDDLHWADEATMALLSFLARHVQRTRVLIVGAFRDVDIPPPLARLTSIVEVVTLEALAEHDAADLARAVAAGRLAPDAVDDVARRAGGNPLFVRELTRLMTAAAESRGEPALHLVGGVREVVTQRLSGLSPACRAMLDIAAVLGSDVRVDVLARSLGGRDDLPDLVAEAVRARILMSPDADLPSLAFVHDLFREVLSAMLDPAVKAQLHLTLARTLAELQADGAAIPHAMVAAHYVNAATRGLRPAVVPAVEHSQHAAAEATRQLAFADAAAHLRRALAALQLADRPDPQTRFEVLLSLGVALDQSGDATAAHDVLVEATDLARQLGDTRRLRPRRHRHPPVGGAQRPRPRPHHSSPRGVRQHAGGSPDTTPGPDTGQPRPRTASQPGTPPSTNGPAPSPPTRRRSPASSTTRPRSPSASSPSTTPPGPSARPPNASPSSPRCSTSPASPTIVNSSPKPSC